MTKIEQKITEIIDAIKAYKILPKKSYQAIGEYLLPKAAALLLEVDELVKDINQENSIKFMEYISRLGDNKETVEYTINDITYCMSVKIKDK